LLKDAKRIAWIGIKRSASVRVNVFLKIRLVKWIGIASMRRVTGCVLWIGTNFGFYQIITIEIKKIEK